MHCLRRSRHLVRFMLAWLVLAMGAAVASPLVRPAAVALVCTASGVALVPTDGGQALPAPGHALDCPLCLHLLAPPPPEAGGALPAAAPRQATTLLHGACPPATVAAPPLPARGPPAFS